MKKVFILGLVLFFGFSLLMGCSEEAAKEEKAAEGAKKTTFVTIGTGGITGVYYPTGGAIARIVNKKKDEYGIRATVESTGGSVFNVNAVMAGDLEFGVVQSDRQYQAINGLAEWKDKGPQKDLRAVFSIHPETVDLIAAVDANINSLEDLKGKRVNIGNVGSGYRQNAIDALEANGLNWEKDFNAESLKAAEAPGLIQDGRIVFSAAKDDILETWALVKGGVELLEQLPTDYFRGVRRGAHGFEALTADAAEVGRRLGDSVVIDRACLDDVVFYTAGGTADA